MYQIMCRVSGGVTGTREGILKKDGEERWFESKDNATREAQRLNEEMNHANSTAHFQYWVI